MRNIALKLMYNGTAYHGWQVQKNAVTVCETLQKALGLSAQAVQTSLDALLTQGLVVPKGAGYTLRA